MRLALVALVGAAAAAHADGAHDHAAAAPAPAPSRPAEGLGSHHRAISCAGAERGAWFDEGLRLYYAFDLEGAERAFRRAEAGGCAIARWGVALALGPNLNLPQLPARSAAARAILAPPPDGAWPVEAALYLALRGRYDGATPAAGDRAYAAAMRALRGRFPHDADVIALGVAARLELRPFAQWSPRGAPAPDTLDLVATLERALAEAPAHPGLVHYYVHAMEGSPYPERALAAADRVGTLMPAAPHLVHMPSHIYLRTGRYADAAAWNRKAIAAGEAWRRGGRVGPIFEMYLLHNHHFLWLAALALGRSTEARAEAELLARACTPEALAAMPGMEPLLALPALTAVRFAEWGRIGALPLPGEDRPFAGGLVRFARVRALAARAAPEADGELAALDRIAASLRRAPPAGANPPGAVLRLAATLARGDLMARRGAGDAAVRTLREVVRLEDALAYDEPPSWPLPARETLGRVLLDAKRFTEAATVFAEALRRRPDDGWSLDGLARALEGQGKPAEALRARAQGAFAEADGPRAIDR